MAKILVLFAHPALEKSRVHARMLHHLQKIKGITINDLYEEYPDFDVDVNREKKLLLSHDIVVMQHPFYWYSSPALLKQWMDLVLEHGWAYGSTGNALEGKILINAISTGGSAMAYNTAGINRYNIRQFLAPFEQTARLCKMNYLQPFVIHGTHKLSASEIEDHAKHYAMIIEQLQSSFDITTLENAQYLNELVTVSHFQND